MSPEQVSSYLKSTQAAEVRTSSRIFYHFYLLASTGHQGATAGTLGLTVPFRAEAIRTPDKTLSTQL